MLELNSIREAKFKYLQLDNTGTTSNDLYTYTDTFTSFPASNTFKTTGCVNGSISQSPR